MSDSFDNWFAEAVTFTPGSAIRLQSLVNAFRSSLDHSEAKHWPFQRILHRLRGSTGRFAPGGPLMVANVFWTRPPLTIGDDGILREGDLLPK